ncbi:hypothetical protein TNCV_2452061 [Trichonephila clavipes]|nr:hypothetical protein TNCV_2452061 [Trichonephila clavipes]
MTEYTNAEKADMILAHGATGCNGRATQRLYAEKHPVRRTPAHTMFARLHQQLWGSSNRTLHSAWSPDWSTLPDILGTSFAKVIGQSTLPLRLVLPCVSSKMEPPHFSISVRNHLDAVCGERWIGRGGPVH